MKLLRVARLDDTDDHVFLPAAQAGELAVTGTFVFTFSDEDPEQLAGKARQAFRNGFLSVHSFGWATVVKISEVSEAEYKGAVESLAHHLVRDFGAPSLEAALPIARQEVDYAASLCEYGAGTMLVLERRSDADGIHEAFKRVMPQQKVADWQGNSGEIRIWDMFPDTGGKA